MPEAVRPADVDQHEEQTHDDGAHREEFPVDDDLPDRLPVIDVCGDDEHDRRRGDSHEEGEVADVEAPADLVPHGRDDEAGSHLPGEGEHAGDDQGHEDGDPGPVGGVPA